MQDGGLMISPVASSEKFFDRVTSRPYFVLIVTGIFIAGSLLGLTRLVKDTSVKAFIPVGHASLTADNKAAEIFGLSDTVAVAIITTDGSSIFRPDVLSLISVLTDQIADLPNIRYDRVASLATESSISGKDGGLYIDPYIDVYSLDAAFAADSYRRWQQMTPHHGTLVTDDASGSIIMAELIDADTADETYAALLDIAASVSLPGIEIHVAGPGAAGAMYCAVIALMTQPDIRISYQSVFLTPGSP